MRLIGLRDDTRTRTALIERGDRTSDIPDPLRDDYADALLRSYYTPKEKSRDMTGEL